MTNGLDEKQLLAQANKIVEINDRIRQQGRYHNNIQKCYFLTTNALAKVIRKGGLSMLNIGTPCYHNGERYPFKMNVVETYQSEIWNDYKNSYRLFSDLNLPKYLKAA